MGSTKNRINKKPERPKTRKELRKDKRLQKKANRVFYHKKKKELKIEYRARLKERNSGKAAAKTKNQDMEDQNIAEENDEEEILSDFELSDGEMESRFSAKLPKSKPEVYRLQEDQQREKQKQKQLEKEMRKQRVRQLKTANEDEDKIIRKLEKQLKIDKTKSQKYVPKMFNDGLEYALELCLPENIENMYKAAKEAADNDDSDNGFQEDILAMSTREPYNKSTNKRKQMDTKQPSIQELSAKKLKTNIDQSVTIRKMNKLRQIESKYFNTEDELDSDLSGSDSEFEHENNSSHDESNASADTDNSDLDIESSDDEAPLEIPIAKKFKNQIRQEKLKNNKNKAPGKILKIPSDIENNIDSDDYSFDEKANDSEDLSGGSENESDNDSNTNKNSRITKIQRKIDNSSGESDIENNGSWEDIYGRNRDKDGNVISKEENQQKYIPPHIRARMVTENSSDAKRKENLIRLQKQLKGYLNRLSEANIHKISTDIDSLYMKNSRFDMNNTLTTLIIDGLVSNVIAPERMVLEHTLLIAVLHANVGSEVGAHFLQTLVDKFDAMMKKHDEYNVENKELDNIIFVICHLYTFKIFQHNLIYDILNRLTEQLTEKTVECVLLTLRSIGFALRKDDPIALKDLILNLQKKASEASPELKNNSRLKYMLDVLLAIKNNNVNKIPQYDPTLAEHLRKILKSMLVNGKYVTTLNITLKDLLNADQCGKWWVVGSAWTGNVKDIGGAKTVKSDKYKVGKFSDHLLALAKKQRMNTDDRRNVFCVLMSAEDFVEAFEKLLQLAIKDHKVIISVVIHCCLSEKIFNLYYAVLTQKFCTFDRKYQLAVQFAIWDRIKDTKSHTSIQLKNLAKILVYLIEQGGLPLSVLKIVDFGELDKITLRLVRQIVLGLLLGKENVCKQVFERIAPSAKLKRFKDSLRLFMHHFLLKDGTKSGVSEDQMDLLKKRIKLADKALETIDSRIQF